MEEYCVFVFKNILLQFKNISEIKNNKAEYTPADQFAGDDSFTYLMSDGHGGTIALSDGLTRRMKSKTLIVTLDGVKVFSAVIPDDAKDSYKAAIDRWE